MHTAASAARRAPHCVALACLLALAAGCRADQPVTAQGGWQVFDRPGSATVPGELALVRTAEEPVPSRLFADSPVAPYRPALRIAAPADGFVVTLPPAAIGGDYTRPAMVGMSLDGAPVETVPMCRDTLGLVAPAGLLERLRGHREARFIVPRADGFDDAHLRFRLDGLASSLDALQAEAAARRGDDWASLPARLLR